MSAKRFLVVAGDPSGDAHAADLVKALQRRDPTIEVRALGGGQLKQVADQFLFDLTRIGAFGFWEPLLALPSLLEANGLVRRAIRDWKPDRVVPVDFYGFNIHVARMSRRAGIPTYYYVSPQVWASRRSRVLVLKKAVTRMLVFFPFEAELYREANVPVSLVRHPLLSRVPPPAPPAEVPIVGLMPGSRTAVVRRHLPILVETARRLREADASRRFILVKAPRLAPELFREARLQAPWLELTTDDDYSRRRQLWLSIGVSGTASLENALLGIPMIIMYRLSWLTYQIARRLIRVPFVGMPNLLAGRQIVPELLQDRATPALLTEEAERYLADATLRQSTRGELLGLRKALDRDSAVDPAEVLLNDAPL